MKKKTFALLCALLLVVQLTPCTTAAVDSVMFTSVNDTILPLSSSTMPFWTDGYLYIPASLFSPGSSTAKMLGITSSYNSEKRTLVLLARNALVFYLDTGSTTDGQNESYPESAVARNGQIFVPASRVADFFQLSYSSPVLAPPYGYVVRLAKGVMMDESLFLNSATGALASRYNDYKQGSAAVPAENPPVTITPAAEIVPEGSQVLYLNFLAVDVELISALLDVLDVQGKSRAAFYFPTTVLESAGDLTRRMSATGQSIGLWADGSNGAEAALKQLEDGNRLLSRNTGGKTRLAFLDGATEETLAQVSAAGWRVLTPKVDYAQRGLSGSTSAAALLKRAGAYGGSVTIWLGGDVTSGGLRTLVSSARSSRDKLLPLTELVQ